MTCLTENIVLSRTRAQDLNSVRKLNCWGSELADVSLVRKMPFVEVLSLSVNSINTLYDFSFCKNLQELYIRKNCIHDLNEVCFLQELPKLKFLWLADNPCGESDNYRMTVLRALPSLVKLDNISKTVSPFSTVVQSHEVEAARTQGALLMHPHEAVKLREASPPAAVISSPPVNNTSSSIERSTSRGALYEDSNAANSPPVVTSRQPSLSDGSDNNFNMKQQKNLKNEPVHEMEDSPLHQKHHSEPRHHVTSQSTPTDRELQQSMQPIHSTFQQQQHTPVQHPQQQIHQQQSSSSSYNLSHHNHAFYARVQTLVDHNSRRPKKPTDFNKCEGRSRSAAGSMQALNLAEDSPNDYQSGEAEAFFNVVDNSDARSSLDSEASFYGEQRSAPRSDKGSPTRVLPKGGRNRNSNILSAVLCLIKELDFASLEVVETAIHCQMEEMEN